MANLFTETTMMKENMTFYGLSFILNKIKLSKAYWVKTVKVSITRWPWTKICSNRWAEQLTMEFIQQPVDAVVGCLFMAKKQTQLLKNNHKNCHRNHPQNSKPWYEAKRLKAWFGIIEALLKKVNKTGDLRWNNYKWTGVSFMMTGLKKQQQPVQYQLKNGKFRMAI